MISPLPYLETPVSEVVMPEPVAAGLRVLVKREDLNHPLVTGNKWWKLKYNLAEARRLGLTRLLTFGGAHSNHLHATAAAARELGWGSIGVVRGERPAQLSPTLRFCETSGMKLHFVSREEYRLKETPAFGNNLRKQYGDFYLIPEGGSNELAVKGVAEFAAQLPSADYVCVACGTGGTTAGLIKGLERSATQIVGFAVLRDDSLKNRIQNLLGDCPSDNWSLITDYSFGGYAKIDQRLLAFVNAWETSTNILLDPIYTAKMFFGIIDRVRQGHFKPGSTVLAIHTGGLQGRSGGLLQEDSRDQLRMR